MKKKSQDEFERFDSIMRGLLKVPHGEVKAKLEAEKAARKRKKPKRLDREKNR